MLSRVDVFTLLPVILVLSLQRHSVRSFICAAWDLVLPSSMAVLVGLSHDAWVPKSQVLGCFCVRSFGMK